MENNNNQEEFFDEREINSVGKQPKNDDMDTSFVEPKKRHIFVKLIVFILIFAVAGACAYYFVIDTPKTFYANITNKFLTNANSSEKLNYNYSIETSISSNKKDMQKIIDIINDVKITGTTQYNNKKLIEKNNIKYKNNELLDLTYMLDIDKKTMYLKLDKVLDKVIKLDLKEEKIYNEDNYDFNEEDYQKIINSLINIFKESLKEANYERNITKLNNSLVIKETLLIDKEFKKLFLTKILQDTELLQTISKVSNIKTSELTDELNQMVADVNDDTLTISVYRNILENSITKCELKTKEDSLTILKDGNKYTFEVIESYTKISKGYIKIDNSTSETKITFNVEDIKDKINVEFYLTYSKNNNTLSELDTNKAISYDELTEEDMNEIMKHFSENKAFKILSDDLNLS